MKTVTENEDEKRALWVTKINKHSNSDQNLSKETAPKKRSNNKIQQKQELWKRKVKASKHGLPCIAPPYDLPCRTHEGRQGAGRRVTCAQRQRLWSHVTYGHLLTSSVTVCFAWNDFVELCSIAHDRVELFLIHHLSVEECDFIEKAQQFWTFYGVASFDHAPQSLFTKYVSSFNFLI